MIYEFSEALGGGDYPREDATQKGVDGISKREEEGQVPRMTPLRRGTNSGLTRIMLHGPGRVPKLGSTKAAGVQLT